MVKRRRIPAVIKLSTPIVWVAGAQGARSSALRANSRSLSGIHVVREAFAPGGDIGEEMLRRRAEHRRRVCVAIVADGPVADVDLIDTAASRHRARGRDATHASSASKTFIARHRRRVAQRGDKITRGCFVVQRRGEKRLASARNFLRFLGAFAVVDIGCRSEANG